MTDRPVDTRGRGLHDLRVSVTDRCNLRCRYCMPREIFGPGFAFLPREELLTFEEITSVVSAFARAGVTKVRLTGGEPLLRANLPALVAMIAAVPGVDDIALTTNGSLLGRHAVALRNAGLSRITVSLDTLNRATFAAVADAEVTLDSVLEGIAAASAAGFEHLKLNAVVDRIAARWPLEPVAPRYPGEVANRYRYRDGVGEVGVISSISKPFCGTCTRARLSAIGEVYTCLFASTGHDLRSLVRSGADASDLDRAVHSIWTTRADRYSELRAAHTLHTLTESPHKVEMSYIGG